MASEETMVLLVPGLGGSGRGHWQSVWARERPDCVRVDMGDWDEPVRSAWLGRLDRAVGEAPGPVVLAAHGLGCVAVAWWATLLGPDAARRVRGALLVAPADPDADPRMERFAPVPTAMLPFASIVAAGHDEAPRARAMAAEWLSDFCDLGAVGHVNARSRLGAWSAGQGLLDTLIAGGPGLSHYAYRREPPVRPGRPVRPASRPVSERL